MKRFFFALLFCAVFPLHASTIKHYDVVIVGAGAGGSAAAIEAARLGASVALIEETDWIGGQMGAAGVSSMDEGGPLELNSGIYGEFLQNLKTYYDRLGKSIGTCYYRKTHHCAEPSVVQKVLYSMMATARGSDHVLDVYLHTRVVKVLSKGNLVTGAITDTGLTLQSHVLVDATEFGDVLPLTPAEFRLANATSERLDPSACVQGMTWVAIIKKYPQGVPSDLWMKNPPPGYTKEVRDAFARTLYAEAPLGEEYIPPVNFARYIGYRGLPDSSNPEDYDSTTPEKITKTEINWFNDISMLTKDFSGGDRKDQLCKAKLKTLQNLYYIQHDLGENLWSIANDEGYDTPYNRQNSCSNIPDEFKAIERNLPQSAYIRESRRLIGLHTLTAGEIRRVQGRPRAAKWFTTSIATNDYGPDLHGCYLEHTLETELEHETDRPVHDHPAGPFQIPLESLIPLKVDGLLAAEKNISQTRIANGSTRLQPSTMLTGQAVGVLAALASKENIQPRTVSVAAVQRILLAGGATLSLDDLADLQHGSKLWQAAQFATVKQWMTATNGKFFPDVTLTQAESGDLLRRVFPLENILVPVSTSRLETVAEFTATLKSLSRKKAARPLEGALRVNGGNPLARGLAAQILYATIE